MSRSPNEMHKCPLFDKNICWSMCYEVQEVRNDDMDMDLFPEPFDINKSNDICSECEWYKVNK